MTHILLLGGVTVVFAGIVLLLLWPTVRSGPRLLRNWGVAEPTSEQGRIARLYLLYRRVLYVALIIVAGLIDGLSEREQAFPRAYFPYLGWFLAAVLLGELIAMLRPVGGQVRVATLERRTIRDVLPAWMIAVHLVTVVAAVAGIAWVDVDEPGLMPGWAQVLVVIVSAVAVYAVAWLTVARPAMSDAAVDRALRLRSVRVTIGLGTMFAATMLTDALYLVVGPERVTAATIGVFVLLFGLVMWGVMASAFAFWSGFRGQVPARNG